MQKSGVFEILVDKLTDLPGIGKKTAQRLAFYIMKLDREEALSLARAIEDVKSKITYCSSCFNLTEVNPCAICSDTKRDKSVICVVENPSDVNAIEKAGVYWGVYHVLGGALSPLDNIGPDDLHFHELEERLDGSVEDAKRFEAELYDVCNDISETRNVVAEHPDVFQHLMALAEGARMDLGDTDREGANQRPAGWVDKPKLQVLS